MARYKENKNFIPKGKKHPSKAQKPTLKERLNKILFWVIIAGFCLFTVGSVCGILAFRNDEYKVHADSSTYVSLSNFPNANYFDITKLELVGTTNMTVSKTTGVPASNITITTNSSYNGGGAVATNNKLIDVAPQLSVGRTYYLSADTDIILKTIYLSGVGIYWDFGKPLTITQSMLDSPFNFYTMGAIDGYGEYTISNIRINWAKIAPYEPNYSVLINAGYNDGYHDGATEKGFESVYGTSYLFSENYYKSLNQITDIGIYPQGRNIKFSSNLSSSTGLYFFEANGFFDVDQILYIAYTAVVAPKTLDYHIEVGTAYKPSVTSDVVENKVIWYNGINNVVNVPSTQYLYVVIDFYGSSEVSTEYSVTLENFMFTNSNIYEKFYDNGYDKGYEDGKNNVDQNAELNGYLNGLEEGKEIGYEDGKLAGKKEGYDNGYTTGYNEGKNYGYAHASDYSFYNLIAAVVDAPLQSVIGLFNFEILGVNLSTLFTGLLTLAIIIFVVRMVV